jgi:hypothetical protein
MPQPAAKRFCALSCAALLALALAACGNTVSTSAFKGPQHEVAQAISDLQADATAGDEKKLCTRDLAASVVTRLGGKSACEKSLKQQVTEIDNLEVTVNSIQVAGPASATAKVKSTYSGKKGKETTISLVKEGGRWKLATVS